MTTKKKPTKPAPDPKLAELTARAEELGITAETAGMAIEQLVARAAETNDPAGFLSTFANLALDAPEPPAPSPQPPDPEPAPLVTSLAAIEIPLTVEIPDLVDGPYLSRHVEVSHLTAEQRQTLWRLREGLKAGHAQLESGRHVDSGADAFRWLLERLEDSG